ncbi:MAG TPA: MAPEG family protein [Candidatus Cybelea sp.]|nr:MAPEG family protein [Candidatus Cybelea sp.]
MPSLAGTAVLTVGLVSLAALVLYGWVVSLVGRARGRFKIAAPAMTGHPEFERAVRVQGNTLEQIVPFLVALWLAAAFSHAWIAAALGVLWLIGRVLYALGYIKDPSKREPGFVIGSIATVALMVAALVGIVMRWTA